MLGYTDNYSLQKKPPKNLLFISNIYRFPDYLELHIESSNYEWLPGRNIGGRNHFVGFGSLWKKLGK
jgi:hypothetical protein